MMSTFFPPMWISNWLTLYCKITVAATQQPDSFITEISPSLLSLMYIHSISGICFFPFRSCHKNPFEIFKELWSHCNVSIFYLSFLLSFSLAQYFWTYLIHVNSIRVPEISQKLRSLPYVRSLEPVIASMSYCVKFALDWELAMNNSPILVTHHQRRWFCWTLTWIDAVYVSARCNDLKCISPSVHPSNLHSQQMK